MKYILRQEYPGSPKEGTEVNIVKPIVGFVYYTDKDKIFHLKKEDVENYPFYYVNVEAVKAIDDHFNLVPNR